MTMKMNFYLNSRVDVDSFTLERLNFRINYGLMSLDFIAKLRFKLLLSLWTFSLQLVPFTFVDSVITI